MCKVPERVQHFVDSLANVGRGSVAPAGNGAASPRNGEATSSHPMGDSAHSAASSDAQPLQVAVQTAIDAQSAPHGSAAAAQVVLPAGRYYIVNSVALLLQHIESLLAFGAVPCALQFDMGSRVGELLRLFNSQSQQLVLGAGAMASAGLRSITARHMAVCSQGLLLLEALMPALRHRVLAGVPPANVGALSSLLDSASEARTPTFILCCIHGDVGALPSVSATCASFVR